MGQIIPLIVVVAAIVIFLVTSILPLRRTIFRIIVWVVFLAAIGLSWFYYQDLLFPLADKYITPLLPSAKYTFITTCGIVAFLGLIFVFICSRIRMSEYLSQSKLSALEESREGLKYMTAYDSAGNAWAKPYYDDGTRYDDTEDFSVKARFSRLFGFWVMLIFYILELLTPIFFILGIPDDETGLVYGITEENDWSVLFLGMICMVVALIIQIILYIIMKKAYAKRIERKFSKWEAQHYPNKY